MKARNHEPVDFQMLFEAAPGLFLVLLPNPPDFTIVAASEAYLKGTKTKREDILSRGLFEVFPDNPDDPNATGARNLLASLMRVVLRKKPDAMAVQKYDIQKPKSEGGGFEERFWSPVNTPVFASNGEMEYIIHRVEDVTEFMRLEAKGAEQGKIAKALRSKAGQLEVEIYQRAQEIQAVNKQLERANKKLNKLDKVKTEFFANISHEFRTPLTLILGPVSESLADKSLPKHHLKQLELIERNTLRLQKLVNNLLDFSSLEAGRMKAAFQPVELGGITKDLASSFQSAMASAGLEYKINCKPMKQKVYVDYPAWEKIVFNLLSNALKYTLKGTVSISLSANGNFAELTVKDTGSGIPKGELPNLYERFHRVEGTKSRSIEGSGIGLALVNELVKLHGGTVTVNSIVGKGSTFTVEVPLGTSHLPADQIITAPTKQSDTYSARAYLEEAVNLVSSPVADEKAETKKQDTVKSRKQDTILVVDDNADMREYIRKILNSNSSLSVVTASNGDQALKIIKAHMPSLIITDIMMPGLDGYELVQRIRQNPKAAHVPIIFLSARASEKERIAGMAEGVDDYLVKPFSVSELLVRVNTRLNLALSRERAMAKKLSAPKK